MSCRDYYRCENCGFSYMNVDYYFCFKDETGVIEKYESLFSTVHYADGSIMQGRVLQRYCKNCNKTVSIYQTARGKDQNIREWTVDFLKKYIPRKKEKLANTSSLLKNFETLLKYDASIKRLKAFLKNHDNDLYYKIDLEDYLTEKSFESMDFNMKDYVKEESIMRLNRKSHSHNYLYDLPDKDLISLHSSDLYLKTLYEDLSKHINELSASDLDRETLYNDISKKLDYVNNNLEKIEGEIPCINLYKNDFNITLDGEKIDNDVCPHCGEKIYWITPHTPCPQCGNEKMEFKRIFFD